MYDALRLLSELTNEDITWILEQGTEQQVITDTLIIHEGDDQTDIIIVLEGLVGVELAVLSNQLVAKLGPGEILGDISFVGNCPAAATVKAVENSLLLVLPRQVLQTKLALDAAFAARFYRACAVIASRRLRERVSGIGQQFNGGSLRSGALTDAWAQIFPVVESLKETLTQADKEALRNHDQVPAVLSDEIQHGFQQFVQSMNDHLSEGAASDPSLSESMRQEIGARIQREILPYLLLTRTAERWYSKPRGYAGDFLTIDWIYQNNPQGVGRLGSLLDRCFLNAPAAQAVRNRRGLLAEHIQTALEQASGETTRITSLACGPAAEIFDVFEALDDPTRLRATLIDIDLQALAFVSDKRDRLQLQRQIELVNGNLVYLATGRQQVKLAPQDLVYSIGLIDYFSDKFVILLLNYIHGLLRPGGKVVLGNFHPRNPNKALMDHILEWKLIHRSEDDMNRLFMASSFAQPCTDMRFEQAGVNLFAECVKQA
jgi:SAM-dependent methyltransferase